MREIGKVALNVTNRSGFDKSHRNLFTGKVGTLYPILTEEVLPNSTIHLKEAISAKMPPLASDTFMDVQLKTECFFVPYRLLYHGWENWLMETPLRTSEGFSYKLRCPVLNLSHVELGSGTLPDYLGWKSISSGDVWERHVNIFPFLAYARIYDDWYRNSRIQAPLFVSAGNYPCSWGGGQSSAYYSVANLPFIDIADSSANNLGPQNYVFDGMRVLSDPRANTGYFADGSFITDLRQRNFGLDYFTSAQPSPQRGEARKVSMQVNGTTVDVMNDSGDGSTEVWAGGAGSPLTTSFTIQSLRGQNSLLQFCERNNYSFRASDYYYINYGSRLRSGLAQRAVFLGQHTIDVYSKTVVQSNATSSAGSFNNPFSSVGAQYGNAFAAGSNSLIDEFTADEPGILMVIASLVPKVTYNTGMRRYLLHFTEEGSQTDLANAILQNVGNQPIWVSELTGDADDINFVFGYTDRYAEWMDHPSEIHGLLKDGESLQSFALQRAFGLGTQPINGSFLKIPDNYLDQVLAVSSGVSGMSYWAEVYFDFKVVQPLNEYSIPSLQDPAYEHGHKIVINKNGGSL